MPLPWPKPWPVMVIALLPGTVQASTFWRGSAPDGSAADAGRAGQQQRARGERDRQQAGTGHHVVSPPRTNDEPPRLQAVRAFGAGTARSARGADHRSRAGTVPPACDTGRVPEGDSVWKLARRLDRQLAGHTVERSDFRTPALATRDLSGREVLGHDTHGKHLLTRLLRSRGLAAGDAPQPPPHGRLVVDPGAGQAAARQAAAPRPARAGPSTTAAPSTASGCTTSPSCRPTARPTWSATSVPTRCATTGTPRRRSAACSPRRPRRW